jgi:hypothetical protein
VNGGGTEPPEVLARHPKDALAGMRGQRVTKLDVRALDADGSVDTPEFHSRLRRTTAWARSLSITAGKLNSRPEETKAVTTAVIRVLTMTGSGATSAMPR